VTVFRNANDNMMNLLIGGSW